MLYVHVIGKNKLDGTYFKFVSDNEAKLKYDICAKHRKSSTASRVELVTPTGEIIVSHDYE